MQRRQAVRGLTSLLLRVRAACEATRWALLGSKLFQLHEAHTREVAAARFCRAGAAPRGPRVKHALKGKDTHLPFETPLEVAQRHGKLGMLDLLRRRLADAP